MLNRCILLFSCILFFIGCALYDIYKLANDKRDMDPKWDNEVTVKILKKEISIKDYIKDINIPSFYQTVPNLLQWPISVGEIEYPGISEDIDISGVNKYDFDNDGTNDFYIKGIRGKNLTFTLIVWLTTTSDPSTILPFTSTSSIDLQYVTIEGRNYTFNSPTIDSQGRLIYTPNNFPDPIVDYYINFEGDSEKNADLLNVPEVRVHLIPTSGTPEYPQILPDSYTLHVQVDFSVVDFDVVGEISNSCSVDIGDISNIPLSDMLEGGVLKVNKLLLNLNFSNSTPFEIDLSGNFTASNKTPDPENYLINISSGNLAMHPNFSGYNNYWYVVSSKDSSGTIIVDKPLQYDDLEMTVNTSINSLAGKNVLFSLSRATFLIELIIKGEVTIDY